MPMATTELLNGTRLMTVHLVTHYLTEKVSQSVEEEAIAVSEMATLPSAINTPTAIQPITTVQATE